MLLSEGVRWRCCLCSASRRHFLLSLDTEVIFFCVSWSSGPVVPWQIFGDYMYLLIEPFLLLLTEPPTSLDRLSRHSATPKAADPSKPELDGHGLIRTGLNAVRTQNRTKRKPKVVEERPGRQTRAKPFSRRVNNPVGQVMP